MFDKVLNSPLVAVDENIFQLKNVLVQSKKKVFHILGYFVDVKIDLYGAVQISARVNLVMVIDLSCKP